MMWVKKLEHYGIRGVAKDLVCSYLENRRQYVCINDCNSECMDVKGGGGGAGRNLGEFF